MSFLVLFSKGFKEVYVQNDLIIRYVISDEELLTKWPNKGQIQFKNVSLRYDKHLDPVVNDINLLIKPGQKVIEKKLCIY